MKNILLVLFVALTVQLSAQTPASYSSSDIYLQLKKMNVLGSVLYIAAHPDDENTRLLAWLAKGKQYRTGYLSLTRGDGGQNLIGDEQGIELGLIRTQELLAARRIDGAEQFFSRAYDFGFSKNAEEALRLWDHDKILSDVVWVIRKFQPDVIITRFPGDERAGHGQHAASSILAKEAFFAAADSSKFPEQFKYGVHPWQAKRIFWNTFNFGGFNTTREDQLKIDIGDYNPLLGESYGEIASESRSQHKSQGFGVSRQRGEATEYFQLTAGAPAKDSLFDGVKTDWARVAGASGIESQISSAIAQYDFEHPEKSIPALVNVYHSLVQLPEGYWKKRKMDELKQIIIECAGIFAEATSNSEYAVQGDSLKVQFFIDKRNNADVKLQRISFKNFDSTLKITLPTNRNITTEKSFYISPNTEVTQPYWLQLPMTGSTYDVKDQTMIGKPENDPAYTAKFTVSINGEDFDISAPVKYKYTDPVKGEVYQPLSVVAPISVSIDPEVILMNVKNGFANNPAVRLQFKSLKNAGSSTLEASFFQSNSKIFSKDTTVNIEKDKTYGFSQNARKIFNINEANVMHSQVKAQLNGESKQYSEYLRTIQYEHIPAIQYYYTDTAKVITEEIKTKGKNIGYIAGAGDKVPQALQQMGFDVKMLNEADLTENNLKQFDAIITGVRAYDVNDFLSAKYNVLMNYIRNGGNLIVQYNRSNLISNGTIKVSPYPFAISSTRVTDENAPVHILDVNNPALNYPNKITQKDFEGWIQERSTYQATNLDNHYKALFGMHDPNEPESKGSLVIAEYGKGNFIYMGLVFFRELPAGVPGAYRLMANLIALPQNKVNE